MVKLPGPFLHPRFPGGLPCALFYVTVRQRLSFQPGDGEFRSCRDCNASSVAQRLGCRSPASKAPKRAERRWHHRSGGEGALAGGTHGANGRFPQLLPRRKAPVLAPDKPAVPRPSLARKRCAGEQRQPDDVIPFTRAGPGPDRPQRSGAGGMCWLLHIC